MLKAVDRGILVRLPADERCFRRVRKIAKSDNYDSSVSLVTMFKAVDRGILVRLPADERRFRRVRKICEKLLLASSFSSVGPHETTRLPLDGFS